MRLRSKKSNRIIDLRKAGTPRRSLPRNKSGSNATRTCAPRFADLAFSLTFVDSGSGPSRKMRGDRHWAVSISRSLDDVGRLGCDPRELGWNLRRSGCSSDSHGRKKGRRFCGEVDIANGAKSVKLSSLKNWTSYTDVGIFSDDNYKRAKSGIGQ